MQKTLQCPNSFIKFANVISLPRMSSPCLSIRERASNFTSNIGASCLLCLHRQRQRLSPLRSVQPLLTCDFIRMQNTSLQWQFAYLPVLLDLWFLKVAQDLTWTYRFENVNSGLAKYGLHRPNLAHCCLNKILLEYSHTPLFSSLCSKTQQLEQTIGPAKVKIFTIWKYLLSCHL